jgi:hypothetical protein
MRSILPLIFVAALAGCASAGDAGSSAPDVRITPDDPVNPKHVRFDVPAAYVLGLPGDRVPITLQARLATREIAAARLSVLGYCPHGFSGPDTVFAPDGDRSRSVFVVDCNPS